MVSTDWTPQPALAPLWAAVLAVRPDAGVLIHRVIERLQAFDADFGAEMAGEDEAHLRDAYLIRFVLPLAELAAKGTSAKLLCEAMTAQLLWCYHWRTLDNVLDSAEYDAGVVRQLTVATVRAAEYHAVVAIRHDLPTLLSKTSLLSMACDAARLERAAGIPTKQIWKRAAPFFIVPSSLLSCSERQLEAYRSYINVLGLCHDVADLFSDVENGILSVPVSWLRAGQGYADFGQSVAHQFFSRAQEEIGQAATVARKRLTDIGAPIMLAIVPFAVDSMKLG